MTSNDEQPDVTPAKPPRIYRPKTCPCGATFTPTGPRAIRCDACRAAKKGT